jgi:hypothetical protein
VHMKDGLILSDRTQAPRLAAAEGLTA